MSKRRRHASVFPLLYPDGVVHYDWCICVFISMMKGKYKKGKSEQKIYIHTHEHKLFPFYTMTSITFFFFIVALLSAFVTEASVYLPEVQCNNIKNRWLCDAHEHCNWYLRRFCIRRDRCIVVEYKCQDIRTFCEFTSKKWHKMQCDNLNKPYCIWKQGKCQRRGWCSDACWWRSHNGICEDGGDNSTGIHFCFLGTDCSDCGIRYL